MHGGLGSKSVWPCELGSHLQVAQLIGLKSSLTQGYISLNSASHCKRLLLVALILEVTLYTSSIPGTAKQWPLLSCRELHMQAADSAHPGFILGMSTLLAPGCHCRSHEISLAIAWTHWLAPLPPALQLLLIPHAGDRNTYFFRSICLMPREWDAESNLPAVCTCGCLSLQVTCLTAGHLPPRLPVL